jgi:hypothetical protein
MNHEAFVELWVKQYRISQKTTYRTPTDLVKDKTKSQLATEVDRVLVLGNAIRTLYGKHPLDIVSKESVIQDSVGTTVRTIVSAVVSD